jgi:hypothetical protein
LLEQVLSAQIAVELPHVVRAVPVRPFEELPAEASAVPALLVQ